MNIVEKRNLTKKFPSTIMLDHQRIQLLGVCSDNVFKLTKKILNQFGNQLSVHLTNK